MPASMWKGAISFGLVTIPVRAVPSTEEKTVRFHQVHRADGGRVRQRRVCEVDGAPVDLDEVTRGFDAGGGQLVIIEDSDLDAAPVPTAHTVDVVMFVPVEQIDPTMHSRSYYLEPEKAGIKAYSLLRDALAAQDRVGVVKVALRQRERLAVLRVHARVLVLELLLWPDEVREPAHQFVETDSDQAHGNELTMAGQLIDSLTRDWDPGAEGQAYEDRYRKAVLKLIEDKAAGRDVVTAPEPAGTTRDGKPVDLLAALRASVDAARAGRVEEPAPEKKTRTRALKSVPVAVEREEKPAAGKPVTKKAAAKKVARPRKSA